MPLLVPHCTRSIPTYMTTAKKGRKTNFKALTRKDSAADRAVMTTEPSTAARGRQSQTTGLIPPPKSTPEIVWYWLCCLGKRS